MSHVRWQRGEAIRAGVTIRREDPPSQRRNGASFGSLEDETPFIIMEYIEGRDLADVLQAEGVILERLPEPVNDNGTLAGFLESNVLCGEGMDGRI